jgi:hypothetical protein
VHCIASIRPLTYVPSHSISFFSSLSASISTALAEARPLSAVGTINCDRVQQHPLQPHDVRAGEAARRYEGERRYAGGVCVGYLTQGRLLRSLWQLLSCVLGPDGGCWNHSDAALKVTTILYCTILYCSVLYCTAVYCTVLYCTAVYFTVM